MKRRGRGLGENQAPLGHRTSEILLQALAEQIKTPLVHIAHFSELGQNAQDNRHYLQQIGVSVDRALHFIDSYLLSNNCMYLQTELPLEPISLAAVMYDTAQMLQPLARQYECQIELSLAGKYPPVLAHRQSLIAALSVLGEVFIEAQNRQGKELPKLYLGAHRSRGGMAAGVYGELDGLTASSLKRASVLRGRARQPFQAVNGSGAGIFVAESIISRALGAKLRVAKMKKNSGLAFTLQSSSQLSLV